MKKKLQNDNSIRIAEEKSEQCTLEFYLMQYEKGRIKIPDHQRRSNVWDSRRKKEFIEDVMNGSKPFIPGVLILYRIEGIGDSYINDGLQRTTVLNEVLKNPEEFGFNREYVEKTFSVISVVIQYFNYKSHYDAAVLFKKVNSRGSILKNNELYKYHLVYSSKEKYNLIETLLLPEVKSCDDFVSKSINEDNKHYDRSIRDIYCNLHRYLTKEKVKSPIFYNNITSKKQNDQPVIEEKLAELFKQFSYSEFEKKLKLFISTLHSIKAIMRECLDSLNKKNIIGKSGMPISHIALSYWRSIICFYLYCKNNDINKIDMMKSIEELLKMTKGDSTSIIISLNEKENFRLRVGYQRIETHIKFLPLSLKSKEKRKKRDTSTIPKGYDISHIKPFSIYGEGDVTIEPSSINRSRGNKESLTGSLFN